jgi:hypothetical protein
MGSRVPSNSGLVCATRCFFRNISGRHSKGPTTESVTWWRTLAPRGQSSPRALLELPADYGDCDRNRQGKRPNEAVTAATDAAGLIGMAAPTLAKDFHLGPLSAGASIANDPRMKNIVINFVGLTDLRAAMATTGALVDFMDWSVNNSSPGRKRSMAITSSSQSRFPRKMMARVQLLTRIVNDV